jgi:hypothetical protein
MGNQINRSETYWQRSECSLYDSFPDNTSTATTTAAKFTVLGSDMKNNTTISILRLQVLLISKPESMTKQTCTHGKSDFSPKLHSGTHYCEEPSLLYHSAL